MKVLLVTDLFPPDAGGRSDKMLRHVEYFQNNAITVDVLCPLTSHSDAVTNGSSNKLFCYRVKPFLWKHIKSLKWQNEFNIETTFGRIYKKLGLPCGYIRWMLPAVSAIIRLHSSRKYKACIFVSNPITNLLIGIVCKLFVPTLKICAELRDPIYGYYMSRHSNAVNTLIEALVARFYDCIVEWADFSPESFLKRNLQATNKYHSIEIVGFNKSEYKNISGVYDYSETMNICYAGNYYNESLEWKVFLTALSHLQKQGRKIQFNHYGDWSAEQELIYNSIDWCDTASVKKHGRVSKASCVDKMISSHLLLYILDNNQENLGRVSSKIYDYFATQRPIISIVPSDSKVILRLNEYNNSFCVMTNEESFETVLSKFVNTLDDCYRKFKNGSLHTYISTEIDVFSCANGENEFANIIKTFG